MSPAVLGALRALGIVVLLSVLTFLGDAANLNGIVSAGLATIISMFALAIEHSIEASTGKALLGMASTK